MHSKRIYELFLREARQGGTVGATPRPDMPLMMRKAVGAGPLPTLTSMTRILSRLP